jgi:hypothetical protein
MKLEAQASFTILLDLLPKLQQALRESRKQAYVRIFWTISTMWKEQKKITVSYNL